MLKTRYRENDPTELLNRTEDFVPLVVIKNGLPENGGFFKQSRTIVLQTEINKNHDRFYLL